MSNLNPHQFGEIPPPMGETPIPEGMVRFHHYTSEAGAEGIRQHGLLQRYAEESFARGGTEAPINFATAGVAKDERLRQAVHVEGWADPTARTGNLDIGEHWRGGPSAEHAERMEKSLNTITFRGDLPAEQIVAVHHPWHSHYRYMMNDERLKQEVVEGQHDNLADPTHAFYDANYAKAIAAVKARG